jgi:hypothetical protein
MSSPVSWEDYATGPSECAPEWSWAWEGLVGLWAPALGPTGNALFDLSGRNNHGTLTNMDPATDWVGSPYGGALDFDGIDDHILVPSSPSLASLSTVTIAVVVFDRSPGSPYHRYAELGGFKSIGGFTLNANDKTEKIRFELWDSSTYWGLNGPRIDTYTWTAWAATYDSVSACIYKNGVLAASGTPTLTMANATTPLYLGHGTAQSEEKLHGQCAVVCLWNRALSSSAIAEWSSDPLGLLRPAWQSPAWWYSPGTPPASSIAAIHDYYRRLRCA